MDKLDQITSSVLHVVLTAKLDDMQCRQRLMEEKLLVYVSGM